jgi:hypothetical protein
VTTILAWIGWRRQTRGTTNVLSPALEENEVLIGNLLSGIGIDRVVQIVR